MRGGGGDGLRCLCWTGDKWKGQGPAHRPCGAGLALWACEGGGPGPCGRTLRLLDRPRVRTGRGSKVSGRQGPRTHRVLGLHPISTTYLCEPGRVKLLNYFRL